jgi:hypothetical protein
LIENLNKEISALQGQVTQLSEQYKGLETRVTNVEAHFHPTGIGIAFSSIPLIAIVIAAVALIYVARRYRSFRAEM